MLTVACVLKSGGEFRPQHVYWLASGIQRNLHVPYRFVCLTDIPTQIESTSITTISLNNEWPGWWSKIELFDCQFDGQVIYFDLDCLIVDTLDDVIDLASTSRFWMLESFWPARRGRPNSSVMIWDWDLSEIYTKFASDVDYYMKEYSTKDNWGDQDLIFNESFITPNFLQKQFPGIFQSYKLTVKYNEIPNGSSVIVYHGRPRPWDTMLGRRVLG